MGPTWGPPGSCRPQMGPMLAPWILLSRMSITIHHRETYFVSELPRRFRCFIKILAVSILCILVWNGTLPGPVNLYTRHYGLWLPREASIPPQNFPMTASVPIEKHPENATSIETFVEYFNVPISRSYSGIILDMVSANFERRCYYVKHSLISP